MEKRMDFSIKHREDVIDSLHLRVKEKRVLLGLIIILLTTLAYENGAFIVDYFISEKFEVPALGARKKYLAKPDMIKQLARRIDTMRELFPQFVTMFANNKAELDRALEVIVKEDGKEEATQITIKVAGDLWKFATHPVLPRTKELTELEKSLQVLQKKLKIDLMSEFVYSEVNFSRAESNDQSKIRRNLFDYENF